MNPISRPRITRQVGFDPARADGLCDDQKHGHRTDDQRRHPRGDGLLGPRNQSVAAQQEQGADDCQSEPLPACGQWISRQLSPDEQNEARDQKAQPRVEEGRDGFHRETDREISRTPDDVNSQ